MKKKTIFALAAAGGLSLLAVLLPAGADDPVINVYSGRHYEGDTALYEGFERATGIRVNYIEGKTDEMLERLAAEGPSSPADIFITTDAGNLWRAKERGLFQAIDSTVLAERVPAPVRDPDNMFFGLSTRARVILYAKGVVDPALLTGYADLARPELAGKLCMRSGGNIYNLSLLAALIDRWGAAQAETWAKAVVANFARPPAGGDTDQIKALASGECSVTIANTYYFVRLLKSEKPEDRAVANAVGVVFPDQAGPGTHVNISGAGIAAHAPHRDAAIEFLEYLVSDEAQRYFSDGNNEYPVVSADLANPQLIALGTFVTDPVNISVYGKNQPAAQEIMDRVGWK